MKTYLINFFDIFIEDADGEDYKDHTVWCMSEVDPYPIKDGIVTPSTPNTPILKYKFIKLLCASSDFNMVYDPTYNDDLQGRFVPHVEADGRLYVCAHFAIEKENAMNDRIVKFETEDDALLYAEVNLRGV